MSIKIYDAFKWKTTDLATIHQLTMEFRDELRPLHLAALAKVMADQSADIIDRAVLFPHAGETRIPYMTVLGDVMDRQKKIKQTMSRDPQVDFDFELCLFPYEGNVYGKIYSEQKTWVNLWMDKDFVEPFSYWNSTDRPEGVTQEEWDKREAVWNAIFRQHPSNAPAMVGLTVQCTIENTYPRSSDIVEALPSFETRLKNLVDTILSGQRYAASIEGLDTEYVRNHVFSLIIDARDWLKTTEAQSLRIPLAEKIGKLIPAEITKNMLLGRPAYVEDESEDVF